MAAHETAIASAVMRDSGLELPPSLTDYLDDIERDVIRQALVVIMAEPQKNTVLPVRPDFEVGTDG